MSCEDLDNMDVYVIIQKLDHLGNALLSYNVPFEHQKSGTTEDMIPAEDVYKYEGVSGRLRASKRAAMTEEPDMLESRQKHQEPPELFFLHDKSEEVPSSHIWAGGIVFEKEESLRLEIRVMTQSSRNFRQ